MKPITILVAEDDTHIRELFRFALQAAEYEVVEASTISAALSSMDEADIALLDWYLDGSAELVLEQWVDKKRAAPLAIISGYLDDNDFCRDLYVKGAWHVLAKPVGIDALMAIVRQYHRYVAMSWAIESLHLEVVRLKRWMLATILASAGIANAPKIAEWLTTLF